MGLGLCHYIFGSVLRILGGICIPKVLKSSTPFCPISVLIQIRFEGVSTGTTIRLANSCIAVGAVRARDRIRFSSIAFD